MAVASSWFVESKEYEMLIRGGDSGLRFVERSKKKQSSIFVHRDELAWLVSAVEEVMHVGTPEVFWDRSRAGSPRVIVQRRSNRHGRFITIEEVGESKRSGIILIPEGYHGQGWTSLISELRRARSSLWKGREFRESKVERTGSARRSYAEAVGLLRESGDECFPVYNEPLARVPKWLKEASVALEGQKLEKDRGGRVQSLSQTGTKLLPTKKIQQTELTQAHKKMKGYTGGAMEVLRRSPAKMQVQVSEQRAEGRAVSPAKVLLAQTLPNPIKSGLEVQNGGVESEGDGSLSLYVRADLQDIKKLLTDIRGEVDLRLKRVESVLYKLEQNEGMGRMVKAGPELGCGLQAGEVGCFKPKKQRNKKKKNVQMGLLGSKPSMMLGKETHGAAGVQAQNTRRELPCLQARKTYQAGETSEAGAMRAACETGAMRPRVSLGSRNIRSGAHESSSPVPAKDSEVDCRCAGEEGAISETPVPVQKSEQLPGGSENAGDLGSENLMPEKLVNTEYVGGMGPDFTMEFSQKQMRVLKRKEVPVSKPTKSWVAERVSWNDSRGGDVVPTCMLGKNHTVGSGSEEMSVNDSSVRGEHEESDLFGGLEDKGAENYDIEGSLLEVEAVIPSEEQSVQGTDSASPAVIDLKFVWDVKGFAGMTDDGQEGKLKGVLGQIVDNNYGKGTSLSDGVGDDGNMRLRDDDRFYEA
jgi:hypothetical protein